MHAYADDIDIIGRTKRDVSAASSAIELESMKMAVSEGQTKYMLSTRDIRRIGSQITAGSYTFDALKEFTHLGSAVTNKNDVGLEIKRRIVLANRYYYGLNRRLSNRDLSLATKLIYYKTFIPPVLLYGSEAWILLSTDAVALRVFEKKVIHKIFGPLRVRHNSRIRTNNSKDVVQHINFCSNGAKCPDEMGI